VRFSFNHKVHTLEEVKKQLAQLQAELTSGLTKSSAQAEQSKINQSVKDGARKHHLK
jgi:hypothetical protein